MELSSNNTNKCSDNRNSMWKLNTYKTQSLYREHWKNIREGIRSGKRISK